MPFLLSLLLSFSAFAACEPRLQTINEVKAKSYAPATGNKVATILILPTILGESRVERGFAASLCRAGFRALILDVTKDTTAEYEIQNLSSHDESFTYALTSVRAVIEGLRSEPSLSGKFGLLGASQGALFSTYIAGSEPAITASVLIVGAGNLPGVLTYSDQKNVKAIRDARKARLNIRSDAEYEQTLAQAITIDPQAQARNIAPDAAYLFIATRDTTVQTKYQLELAQVLSGARVKKMDTNHVNGIIRAGQTYGKDILSYFREKL
jgi:dienelactone hydrolase